MWYPSAIVDCSDSDCYYQSSSSPLICSAAALNRSYPFTWVYIELRRSNIWGMSYNVWVTMCGWMYCDLGCFCFFDLWESSFSGLEEILHAFRFQTFRSGTSNHPMHAAKQSLACFVKNEQVFCPFLRHIRGHSLTHTPLLPLHESANNTMAKCRKNITSIQDEIDQKNSGTHILM